MGLVRIMVKGSIDDFEAVVFRRWNIVVIIVICGCIRGDYG